MPTIRAVVFGIMLFMFPIALLFILTPINLRVASFALGLFVFVALWGVIDAGIYQLTLGRAMDALAEMRSNAVATNAWLLAPSAAQKALAIFGSFRTAAAGLAGAFVFTVFRFSGNVFTSFTSGSLGVHGQASAAAAPLATGEGYASALEAQASATGTMARRNASSNFGDFGERSTFGANRSFGAAGGLLSERASGVPGVPAFGMGGIDAARELGGLTPALVNGDLSNPAVQRAVRANATTAAIHQFAEKDELSSLGNRYFGEGQVDVLAFAVFARDMVQWRASGAQGFPRFGRVGIEAAREVGGPTPALVNGDLSNPAVQRAVRANATTAAIHQFAEKDALRSLGNRYFGEGQAGERAFASFAQNMVQWRAFGDQRAYDMMLQGATRHFSRNGYGADDAQLKAASVISEASADPTFAKLIANTFDQEAMLQNDLTSAQVQVGAMEGRRDYAGDRVAQVERGNVATEQAHRTGSNEGQRNAAAMLGLSVDETSRRISFINALSGEARSSAISQLSRATGRNEAQVMHALESYNAAVHVGTADGATAEAAREGTSVYGRTREAAGYDFAERAGKLDAQREVGHDGTRNAARIGEQRRQSENFGFAEGAEAAGVSTREAARLDSFIQTLSRTAGNQVDMAEGGSAGVADRARNERLTRIVDNERLTRAQGLLRSHGIDLTKRQIAMDQNGDFSLNLTPETAAQMWRAGLINQDQLGAVANGGSARFSFAHNDLLISSSTGFQRSARSDTSTRFEAGKQAGPDTIEHFLGSGTEGQAAMANWLKGGFEMDRSGNWRLKPQVADTLERDVTAIMVQTGWQRSLSRGASHQVTNGDAESIGISGGVGGRGSQTAKGKAGQASGNEGGSTASINLQTSDLGVGSTDARSSIDIVNHDVRNAIANAERAASRSRTPEAAFSSELGRAILGADGLRNRYLDQADAGRGPWDATAPFTSIEQSQILRSGRFTGDRTNGLEDGDPEFKRR